MSFVSSDREADGEPLVDELVAKRRAEEVEGYQTRLRRVLDLGRLLHEGVRRRGEEACREEEFVVGRDGR